MDITRREFHGHLAKGTLVITVAGSTILLGGCSLAGDIENWTPVGIAALKSIELVLSTNGFLLNPVQTTAFNAAIAALQAVDNAAIAYGKIQPPPATLSQELYAAFQVATQQIQAFLTSLALPASNLLNLIVGLAQIIFSTILGFMNRLPAPAPAAKASLFKGTFQVAAITVTVTPKERKRHIFKRDFNAAVNLGEKAGVFVAKGVKFPWVETL